MPSYRASFIVNHFLAAVEREVQFAVDHRVFDRVHVRIAIRRALAHLVAGCGLPRPHALLRRPLGPRNRWFPSRPEGDGLVVDLVRPVPRGLTFSPGFCPVHGWSCPARGPPAGAFDPRPPAEVVLPRWRPPTPAPSTFRTLAARHNTARSFITTDADATPGAAVLSFSPHLLLHRQIQAAAAARPEPHLPNRLGPALAGRNSSSSSSSFEEADSFS